MDKIKLTTGKGESARPPLHQPDILVLWMYSSHFFFMNLQGRFDKTPLPEHPMQLILDGQRRNLIEIQDFRTQFGLPENFGIALFSPKDYSGMGSLQGAGAALNQLKQEMLAATPQQLSLQQWLILLPQFQEKFRQKLTEINDQVGLKAVEIDFAMAGFGDVCQAFIYTALQAKAENKPWPQFQVVYQNWLDDSVRVFPEVHRYQWQDEQWQIRVFAHAYGRAGLITETSPTDTFYLHDPALGCPAEGFMENLLYEITKQILF
jgi:hypothetical protein